MMRKSKEIAGKNGKLIVGILTDEAVMEKKPKPVMTFKERIEIAASIKYVDETIPQNSYSPFSNIIKIKPDVLMESESHDEKEIEEAKILMHNLNGRLVIVPYYKYQSSTKIKNLILKRASL